MEKELLEERKKVIYELICDELYIPMKMKEIASLLQVPKEDREDLKIVLDELLADGKIEVSKKGKFSKASGKFLTGIYTGHQKGFGFVTVEGMEEDIFISESSANGAVHKDTVQVVLTEEKGGKRKEGAVVKVLSHGMKELVGTFQKSKSFGFVVTDNTRFAKDIFVPLERSKGAVTGHKVVVEITDFGSNSKKPEGKVKEIIGHINDPGTDIMSIVKGYELPVDFPERVMNQVENVSSEVTGADMAGRMDIRSWQTVTIDGEDAKDLDDAITLTKEGDLYKLGVHIADVTNYVQERSALDVEALKRGTSVYLVDRVIPMLPHKLSNGICSLNAGVDRLALSCIMTIDGNGNMIDHKIAETVINVDRRMTYTSVKKILEDKDEAEMEEYKELVPMFLRMEELAGILREKRRKRGSIDFDFPESKIILDAKGKPLDIKPYERNVATKIIEDFMLAANETVAQDYFWQELPFVYRVHDNPDPEKIQKLALFINNFGYGIKATKDEIHPKELQKLLQKIEDTPEEALISRLTLRSMKQAKYATISTGHFGLAAKYYCHFTSPIRRYPDLQIHRIIKDNLRGRMNEKRMEHYHKILPEVAVQSSAMERRADEAERETEKLKKVEYMQERIGEVFDGVISSITTWGIYVELANTVEGLVHVTSLEDDYYYYDESVYEMVGDKTGNRYKLGQKVKVKVFATDKILRTIDFKIVLDEEEVDLEE
ncbi:ribonuclease R [Candidatus Galacturonibacter soehngenii]|uniref:Ribonuclease R n=1 Tax=Candidatus Galacturonatibacter soehngenii TaxID=2307010 RepID=A0A7V7UCN6_9FIRM|nr:ribonuclease R [Candidatus Galacturonibacter soehngenii]KAB1439386.1 ribonuclease R [Candidatus Galacturonibacter soehngenii]